MKIDNGDANKNLGIIIVGLFISNLGFFINKFARDTSIEFLNGLKSGICAGMQIVGVAIFAYGLVSLIKHNRNK